MDRLDTIISARMSLSVRSKPSQVECSFTVDGGRESRTVRPMFSDKLLSDHHKEVVLATQGFRASSTVLPTVRRELQRIIPRSARASLQDAVMRRPEATAIALEIKLNDPLILERYPWELLAGYRVILDRKIAVIVWRSVAAPTLLRRPSSSVLLVGSASLDTKSTNAAEELAHLTGLIKKHSGINPYPRPSVTFSGFLSLLVAIQPSVIHIVVHGDIRGFQFQEEPEFSRTHFDILPQELAGYLATSPTAILTVLNACDSANSWDHLTPMARQIATRSSTTTIGMSTEVPNSMGAEFSEGFFQALIAGRTTIEAFGWAVEVIRRAKKFTSLWSIPIMYAPPDADVILFPADPLSRIRLRSQELVRQLNQLESEAAGLIEDAAAAPGPKRGLGVATIRLAYIRDLINDLEQPSTLQEPEYVYPRLLLRQTRNHTKWALEELGSILKSLQSERHPGKPRTPTVRSIQRTLHEQALAFAQIERSFTGSK